MKENLILIGFMGAGKTCVGECYADRYGWPLVDTDHLIEEMAGMTISDIFALRGEGAFRDTETQVLDKLLRDTDRTVISVGGGLPLRAENREKLSHLGRVVFLRAGRDEVLKRLEGDTTRPILAGEGKAERVDRLLAQRNPIYEEAAGLIVDVDSRTPDQIVDQIVAQIADQTVSETGKAGTEA